MSSNISQYLQGIQSAIYGREVRDAIYNAILECYNDSSSGETLASAAAAAANEAAANVATALSNAILATQAANDAADSADTAAESATSAALAANNAAVDASSAASDASAAATSANQSAINAANASSYFCSEYDPTEHRQYEPGEYTLRNGVLYKAKVPTLDHTPPNATYWKATTVGDELQEVVPTDYTADDIIETSTKEFLRIQNGQYYLGQSTEIDGDLQVDGDLSVGGTPLLNLLNQREGVGYETIRDMTLDTPADIVLQRRIGTTGASGYITYVLGN